MRHRLMTKLGVDQTTADRAIAALSSNILLDIVDFIEKAGPYAKQAVLAALPFILKGDVWGAVKAVVTFMLMLIPPPVPVEVKVVEKVPEPPPVEESELAESTPILGDVKSVEPPKPHGKKR